MPSSRSPERAYSGGRARNAVNRDLRGIHVVFITISGVIGSGIYVRSGTMLQVGGPGAIITSFAILGAFICAVVMTIMEMVLIWPISNSLIEFVQEFVDQELGIVVGIAYWFCYAIGFAALNVAAASEATYWYGFDSPIIQILGYYIAPPLALFMINCASVKWYGWLEIVGGSLKLMFLVVIFIIMVAINRGVGPNHGVIGADLWLNNDVVIVNNTVVRQGFIHLNGDQPSSWVIALLIAIQIGAYAYVGIELPAVTAVEVEMNKVPADKPLRPKGPVSNALEFSKVGMPVLVTVIYLAMAAAASFDVAASDACLSPESWKAASSPGNDQNVSQTTTSVFICSAIQSGIPSLPTVMTIFLLITAWSSANTALYAASRTLFGMTRRVEMSTHPLWKWPNKLARLLGRVSDVNHVPVNALLFSTLAFSWVPFLHLASGQAVNVTLDVLAEMGSVCCVMVWACECYAFLQFYRILRIHKGEIKDARMKFLQRAYPEDGGPEDRYPYIWRSPWQPYTALFALIGCLGLLLIINGVTLWTEWYPAGFAAAYLAPICAASLWIFLKIWRYRWHFEEWRGRNVKEWAGQCREALERLNSARDERQFDRSDDRTAFELNEV